MHFTTWIHTIFTGVTCHNFGLRSPAVAVPALNFDLIRDVGGCVPHNKSVSLDQVLPPDVLHPQLPVAHFVLKARSIVFNGHQRLQYDSYDLDDFKIDFHTIMASSAQP